MAVACMSCIRVDRSAENVDQLRGELKTMEKKQCIYCPLALSICFVEAPAICQFHAMHFPHFKSIRKHKAPPKNKEQKGSIPNPPKQPGVAVKPVLLPVKEPGESKHAEPLPPPDQQLSSPVPAPLGPALAENHEIQQIWAEIQEKVASLAQRHGGSINPGMQIGDVMGTLESTEHPDVEPGKRDAVKKVFGNTLKVIQTVGGLVADGASEVREYEDKSHRRVRQNMVH